MLLASIAALLLTQVETGPLDLSCGGRGAARRVESSTAYGANNVGQTGWATVEHQTSEAFEDQVDVHVEGDASRIRLPRTMLPSIHDAAVYSRGRSWLVQAEAPRC